ncbi:hypothetical protein H1Q78_09125 [Cellulosimicrobium cellulans]|uniref:hypothetical protein n=1 Tax=Cellulosimicrobium cellulans TaxID=1710 RepID=UPI001EDC58E5|nr:hypothetical protein [Cellulosimicrobium cellulans]UKJ65435.1 hypothetical protein H1Q78_09125 [Cellulosimicrobium cellulans]
MLQRIIAALLLVGGLVAVGLGVASATVWRDSDTVVATTAYTGDGTMLVTEPGVLDLVAEDVTIRATAPGEQQVTLAIGREVDVTGWVGEDAHGVVTGLSDWDVLATRAAEPAAAEEPAEGESPAEDAPAEGETPAEGEAAEGETPADGETSAEGETPAEAAVVGVDPAGSDMWFEESTGPGSASLRWSDQPGRWQLLVAGVGEGAVAPTLELSWPRQVETPYLWPGVIGGAVLILLGLGIGAASLRPKRRGPSGRGTATSATPAVAPAAPGTASGERDGDASDGEVPTDTAQVRMLTRRELREREEADRLAQQQSRAQKPRRAWLTGQIPIVARGERRPKTAAQPAVDATDGHPTTQDSATTRADAWRRAWGFTPGSTGTSEAPDPQRDTDETKDSTR